MTRPHRTAFVRHARWCLGALSMAVVGACGPDEGRLDACTQRSIAKYEERIEPILTDDHPSSCNECHLSGVDLSLFVRDTPCETMACMVSQGLVDLKAPEQSKVLSWIERATPQSELVTEEVIRAEYDAFYEWIDSVASCGACSDTTCPEARTSFCDADVEPAEAYDPAQDPGGCEDKVLEQLFLDTVYTMRGRCYPCHYQGASNPPEGALLWITETDNCAASSLETLRSVERYGLASSAGPFDSLLLLKPLAEKDGGVPHGGHDKFIADDRDPAYGNVVYFLTRYAECNAAP